MKKYIILCGFIIIPTFGYSHPGRTDASGGHNNRKTGEYHYHSGGKLKNSGKSIRSHSAKTSKSKATHRKR